MKKLIFAALICFIGLVAGCKDKHTETEDMTGTPDQVTTETDTMPSDTSAVAPPPIDNPEPGVEKSGSQEQVP